MSFERIYSLYDRSVKPEPTTPIYISFFPSGIPINSRLIIGIPDGKKLIYVGVVGSGFTQRSYKEILSKLKPAKKSPFEKPPDPNRGTRFRRASTDIIYWVKPEVKCLIRYSEITNDGLMRHPSFKGLAK